MNNEYQNLLNINPSVNNNANRSDVYGISQAMQGQNMSGLNYYNPNFQNQNQNQNMNMNMNMMYPQNMNAMINNNGPANYLNNLNGGMQGHFSERDINNQRLITPKPYGIDLNTGTNSFMSQNIGNPQSAIGTQFYPQNPANSFSNSARNTPGYGQYMAHSLNNNGMNQSGSMGTNNLSKPFLNDLTNTQFDVQNNMSQQIIKRSKKEFFEGTLLNKDNERKQKTASPFMASIVPKLNQPAEKNSTVREKALPSQQTCDLRDNNNNNNNKETTKETSHNNYKDTQDWIRRSELPKDNLKRVERQNSIADSIQSSQDLRKKDETYYESHTIVNGLSNKYRVDKESNQESLTNQINNITPNHADKATDSLNVDSKSFVDIDISHKNSQIDDKEKIKKLLYQIKQIIES